MDGIKTLVVDVFKMLTLLNCDKTEIAGGQSQKQTCWERFFGSKDLQSNQKALKGG